MKYIETETFNWLSCFEPVSTIHATKTFGFSEFLAAVALLTVIYWIYYAFIRPPVFGRRNALRFARELYRYILRGNDDELKVIANELARSAEPLIKYCRRLQPRLPGARSLLRIPRFTRP